MGNFKGLRKKLLAGLCAFASGVGGAGAVPQNTSTSEGLRLLYRAYRGDDNSRDILCTSLSVEEKAVLDFLVGLEDSDGNNNNASILQAASVNEAVGDTVRNSRFTVKNNKSAFDFAIETEMYKGGANTGAFAQDPILSFRVEIEYIAKRLVNRHYKIEGGRLNIGGSDKGEIGNIKNMNAFLNIAKCDLYDIAVNDVMGLGMPVYSTGSGDYVISDDPPAPTAENHPDFAGCWGYFLIKCFVPAVNTNLGNENAWWVAAPSQEQAIQFKADRKAIFEKFFGNGSKFKTRSNGTGQPQGSDYYRSMWKAPAIQIKKVMGAGGKVGVTFGVIGTIGALGASGYMYLERERNRKMQATYDEELKGERKKSKSLQSQIDKWNKVEKLAKLKNAKTFFSIKQMVEKSGGGVAGKRGDLTGKARKK